MARYSGSSYGGRGPARWAFIIVILLIAGGVALFMFGKRSQQSTQDTTPLAVESVGLPVVETLAPELAPVRDIAQEEQLTEPQTVETDMPALETAALSQQDSQVASLISSALANLDATPPKVIEARDELNSILAMDITEDQQQYVMAQMAQLADKWLFSKTIYPGETLCTKYKVLPGDLLTAIGTDHKVPYEILMRINGIDRPELLRAGQYLKVTQGPFHAKIYKSKFRLDLYLQNTYVMSFPVGLAREGHDTPSGLWLVKPTGKMIRPTWTDPDTGRTYEAEDPDYPLGARWIALEGIKGDAIGRTGFALHGTNDENSIGTAASRGCIRMHNANIILMYELMMPGYSQVKIVD